MTPGSNDAHARSLPAQLRALAADERGVEAPSSVEARIMRAWDEHHETTAAPAQRPFTPTAAAVASLRGRRVALATAAAILLSIVGWTWQQRHASPPEDQRHALAPPTPPSVAPRRAEPTIAAPVEMPTPIASRPRRPAAGRPRPVRVDPAPAPRALVVVGAPITTDEEVRVVRVRVDRETLAGMGLRPVVHDDDAVEVELIVGEDGVARGLRLGP